MGISADRLAGYFVTSASKRAASCGEKIEILSVPVPALPLPALPFRASLLMHHPPRPRFSRHIHLFLDFARSQPSRLSQLQHPASSILALPRDRRPHAIQFEPRVPVPHRDSFFT